MWCGYSFLTPQKEGEEHVSNICKNSLKMCLKGLDTPALLYQEGKLTKNRWNRYDTTRASRNFFVPGTAPGIE